MRHFNMDNTKNNEPKTSVAPTQSDPTVELARLTAGIEISSSSRPATTVTTQTPQIQNAATVALSAPQTNSSQVPVGTLSNHLSQQPAQNKQNRNSPVKRYLLTSPPKVPSSVDANTPPILLANNGTNYSGLANQTQHSQQTQVPTQSQNYHQQYLGNQTQMPMQTQYPQQFIPGQAQMPIQQQYPQNWSSQTAMPFQAQFAQQNPSFQAQMPMQPQYSYNAAGGLYPSAQVPLNQYNPYNMQTPYPVMMNNTNYQYNPYLNGGFIPQFPFDYLPLLQQCQVPSTQQLNDDDNESGEPTETDNQVLIYAFYIPLELKINGEIYAAVKIGRMKKSAPNFGKRLGNLKGGWKGRVNLPTAGKINDYWDCYENGDDWELCLARVNFSNTHLIFLLPGMADNEHTIRADLLSRFGGFALPTRVIKSMLASVQDKPFPDLSNAGHTEFIALRVAHVMEIRNAFIAEDLSIISHPVQLLVMGQAIAVKDTVVLDFNDEDEDEEDN